MTRTKVFVGNLSFKTKREDLASEFGAAGKVVEANIISRGNRSLGYGFVEMESEEDAQKAITIMNKKPIDSREINVELAKPRDETKIGERRAQSSARGKRRYPRRPRATSGNNAVQRNSGSPSQIDSPSNNNNKEHPKEGGAPRDSAQRGNRRRFHNRRYRKNFPRKDLPPRKESETSLFVANLPFAITDEALSDLYKSHNVKSAHVVTSRNGKSKGFGFVELASQADQKNALEATNKTKVDGRELIVKIALTPIEPPKEANTEAPSEAPKEQPKN